MPHPTRALLMLALAAAGCDPLEPPPCVPACRVASQATRAPELGLDTIDGNESPLNPVMALTGPTEPVPCSAVPVRAVKRDDPRSSFGAGPYVIRRSSCRPGLNEATAWHRVDEGEPYPVSLSFSVAFDPRHSVDGVNEFCLTKLDAQRGQAIVDPSDDNAAWWWSDILRIERVCLPPEALDPAVLAALDADI